MTVRYAAGFRSDLATSYAAAEKLSKKVLAFSTAALKDAKKCTEEWGLKVIEQNEALMLEVKDLSSSFNT